MDTRIIGRTGLSTPAIAFGGIPVNRVGEEQGVATVRRCVELGYRLFDTSRTYGDSERRIGLGLGGRRDGLILATKLGPWKVESERDAEGFIRDSLAALGAPRADIFMIKNLDNEDNLTRCLTLALPAVKRARDAGLIGHIGMTSHVPSFAMDALRTGEFSVAMLPYNIANRAHEHVLDFCGAQGIGVLVMKPLAGGALVEPGERELPSIRDAFSFCLSHPAASAIVVGVGSVHEAEAAWQAGEQARPLSTEEWDRLVAAAESLGEDYCRGCGYCLPCSSEIDIGDILQTADRVRRFHTDVALRDSSRAHYGRLAVTAAACAECLECVERCPFDLDIPERLREAHKLLSE
ncbi:MAG: aldo/keto reductase [Armatimonadota bacterium]|nr:MAG: aldo/keto reductase [Armatimonadota bacterium]